MPGTSPRADRARLSRAAVLAVVICAIALSLAYPVREYIAQRRQIDQLQAQRHVLLVQLQRLEHEQGRLGDPAYVRQLAASRLHLCPRGATCYVVIPGRSRAAGRPAAAAGTPWYERLWQSVQVANRAPR